MIAALAASGAGCSSLPRDPEGTLQRVRGGRLRVGLVEQPPWVVRAGRSPAGAEVELVRRFADELGATPEGIWGGEEEHMQALEQCELDLVVGGLPDDTPWSDRVGLAGPYFEDRVRVGVPDATPSAGLRGLRVGVHSGDPAAAQLRKEGAIPVPVPDLAAVRGPVAAADWHLERLGLPPAGVTLQTRKHVMAVPPGENGWVRRLEEFFDRQRPGMKALLQREVARP